MLGTKSLPDGRTTHPLQVETNQDVSSHDVASQRSLRFTWTALGLAGLMLIGASAFSLHPRASHTSTDPSRHAHEAAFVPISMPVLSPRGMHPASHPTRAASQVVRGMHPASQRPRAASSGSRLASFPVMSSNLPAGARAGISNVVMKATLDDSKVTADVPTAADKAAADALSKAVEDAAGELLEEECEIEAPEKCEEEKGLIQRLISKTVRAGSGKASKEELQEETVGDSMEAGWSTRGERTAVGRTVEVWRFLASCASKVLKARKKKGTEEEISAGKTAAAEFIRDGLFRLGPTFVKFGQVISTRTDVLDKEYIDVLKDLQDNVPGFGGDRAISIIEAELGKPIGKIFDSFEKVPLAAASLGQVHKAVYKGAPVAIKVQRAGLKDLFDADLKNLKTLANLLDKFDPKSDGADRSYADIYDESAKLLYEEIDYVLEAKNAVRFKESFEKIGIDYVRVPKAYMELTTPQVLTMEYVDAIKMTDLERLDKLGLDKEQLAQRIADAFLAQILKTTYFHCDPHPGNLQCDNDGNLVYFDMGMMNQLQPNVAKGFKEACFAIFGGGPFISDIELNKAGKRLVAAGMQAGIVSPSADRLAVEKFARFLIRAFKDVQQGKEVANIKETIGADLQTLTDANVFRFPSTFTFIFRSLASIEGIGKGLAPDTWDIGKSAQPFVQALSEEQNGIQKFFKVFGKATGLNKEDVESAVTQPRKVAYLEKTIREIEQGNLKIRVRSIENEVSLTRLTMSNEVTNKLIVSTMFLILWSTGLEAIPATIAIAGAVASGAQAAQGALKIKVFDKKQRKFDSKDFNEGDGTDGSDGN